MIGYNNNKIYKKINLKQKNVLNNLIVLLNNLIQKVQKKKKLLRAITGIIENLKLVKN
jgi:hypothetical protein